MFWLTLKAVALVDLWMRIYYLSGVTMCCEYVIGMREMMNFVRIDEAVTRLPVKS